MLDQMNFSMTQSQSMLKQEEKDMETLLDTFTEEIGSQQDQHFLQDNFVPKKIRIKDYSNTKVKRNLLTNVSYRGFKQSDFKQDSFVIDILSFILENFNPINLERKSIVKKIEKW